MGTGPILFIVGYGLGTTVLDNQAVLMVLRIVSMVAILWLAWMIATAPVPGGTAQQEGEMRFGFLPAMLLQWVNPKVWIVSVSIVGTFMAVEGSAFEQAAELSLTFIIAAAIGCFPWLASGTALRSPLPPHLRASIQHGAWVWPRRVDDHADLRRKPQNV